MRPGDPDALRSLDASRRSTIALPCSTSPEREEPTDGGCVAAESEPSAAACGSPRSGARWHVFLQSHDRGARPVSDTTRDGRGLARLVLAIAVLAHLAGWLWFSTESYVVLPLRYATGKV